jgi:hypothetical protein
LYIYKQLKLSSEQLELSLEQQILTTYELQAGADEGGLLPKSLTIDKQLLNINLTGVGSGVYILPFPFGGFLQVTEGEFVNVTISAATIRMTIVGYYKPAS